MGVLFVSYGIEVPPTVGMGVNDGHTHTCFKKQGQNCISAVERTERGDVVSTSG